MATAELCWFCSKIVDTGGGGWYRQVSGWEQVRSAGGANKIALRQTRGNVAHAHCVELRITRGQTSWGMA